jgi:hypothetical protein
MKQEFDPQTITRRSMLVGLGSALMLLPIPSALARAFAKAPKWDSRFELAIRLELPVQEGFRVHRPYVAVWIEDLNGKSLRTVSLWVQTQRRGPRWIPDLRRWYRGEESRAATDGGDLVTTISSATRNAGIYDLVWDGKTDKEAVVTQGEYYVCIEAVREHGSYQLIREKIRVGNKPFNAKYTGNEEIKEASVDFRKRRS